MGILKTAKRLKRTFLAQMPVMGPHDLIEAELMLAGIKPVAQLVITGDQTERGSYPTEKWHRDRKSLDQAVKEGKLISADLTFKNGAIAGEKIRHYCKPENEEKMRQLLALNEHQYNEEALPKYASDITFYELLGYRKRDKLFFENIKSLPKFIKLGLLEVSYSAKLDVRQALTQMNGKKTTTLKRRRL